MCVHACAITHRAMHLIKLSSRDINGGRVQQRYTCNHSSQKSQKMLGYCSFFHQFSADASRQASEFVEGMGHQSKVFLPLLSLSTHIAPGQCVEGIGHQCTHIAPGQFVEGMGHQSKGFLPSAFTDRKEVQPRVPVLPVELPDDPAHLWVGHNASRNMVFLLLQLTEATRKIMSQPRHLVWELMQAI